MLVDMHDSCLRQVIQVWTQVKFERLEQRRARTQCLGSRHEAGRWMHLRYETVQSGGTIRALAAASNNMHAGCDKPHIGGWSARRGAVCSRAEL